MQTKKKSISAEMVADSTSAVHKDRIVSMILTFPRIVLAEFNTHRMFSRNSASSRAVPFKKMLKMVWSDPFIPIAWMKDHKGMQGQHYFEGFKVFLLTQLWLTGRNLAVLVAWLLSKVGLTKQLCNRLLEPFMWHTVLLTTTEVENFFALRAHEAAEIHIQELAYKMMELYNSSYSTVLQPGEWHIPFGDRFDDERLMNLMDPTGQTVGKGTLSMLLPRLKVKIATARGARLSYYNFEGKDDYGADVKLHDDLIAAGHMSPSEHCAQVMSAEEYKHYVRVDDVVIKSNGKDTYIEKKIELGMCGNFRGFKQYRKMLSGENKKDERVKK